MSFAWFQTLENDIESILQGFDLNDAQASLPKYQSTDASNMNGYRSGLRGSGMGVWSLNPNKWGMTPDQANAYDLANAQASAAATAANPGVLDQMSSTVKMVGIVAVLYLGYHAYKGN